MGFVEFTGKIPWDIRLHLRGCRQGQLLELPQEADRVGEGRGCHRLRQYSLERVRCSSTRCSVEEVRQVLQRLRDWAQQGSRRRPKNRDLHASRWRRYHYLPSGQLSAPIMIYLSPPVAAKKMEQFHFLLFLFFSISRSITVCIWNIRVKQY